MIGILRFALITVAILAAGYAVPGFHVDGILPAALMAAVFTVVGAIVRPILILLTLPITLLTFGLFLLIINACLFWLSAVFVPGITVDNFLAAFLGALTVTLFRFVGKWHMI